MAMVGLLFLNPSASMQGSMAEQQPFDASRPILGCGPSCAPRSADRDRRGDAVRERQPNAAAPAAIVLGVRGRVPGGGGQDAAGDPRPEALARRVVFVLRGV